MNRAIPSWISLLAHTTVLLFALPAHAEQADRDKPVNLESDTVEVNDQTRVSTYQGNVRLTQVAPLAVLKTILMMLLS